MNVRRWRRHVAWLACGVLLAGCGGAAGTSTPQGQSTPASGVERTTLRIGTVAADWSVQLPQWVALDQGYFRAEGLDNVSLPVVGPGSTHVAALIANSFDVSANLSTDSVLRADAQGAKIDIIGGWSNMFNYALYSRPDIHAVQDVKGKIVAVDQPGSSNDNMVREVMQHFGLQPGKDVTLTPIGAGPARSAAVIGGSAAAVVSLLTDEPWLASQGVHILFRMSELYPDYTFGVIASPDSFVRQNPKTLAAFFRAMLHAWSYLAANKDHPDVIEAIIAKNGGQVDAKVFPEQLKIWLSYAATNGAANEKGLQVVVQREKTVVREIPESFDVAPIEQFDALHAAQKALGAQ